MAWGGVFLSLGRPTAEQRKWCLAAAGGFNYDEDLRGATRPRPHPADEDDSEALVRRQRERGFRVNRCRVLVGSGADAFERAKAGLLSWKHLALGWASVEPHTPVAAGTRFCICYRELIPCLWIMLPLQMAYVLKDSKHKEVLALGSGTLQGHLLAGEERFSVEVDEQDRVWYEVLSFSKPAHILAALCYPYVRLRQRHFARHSANAILTHVNRADD